MWYQNCWKGLGHHWANQAWKFWCTSPRWWEVSDLLHTNSIDRLTVPNLITTLWGRVGFLILYIGQLEFENLCLFYLLFKESQQSSKPFAYYCVHFYTITTLDKIWLSGKFHLVLCILWQILKINFASTKTIFLWRQLQTLSVYRHFQLPAARDWARVLITIDENKGKTSRFK